MSDRYQLGVIVGRFQILHKGHSQIIRQAAGLCRELAIFVGSSQESRSYKNPFDYEERKSFLLSAFPGIKVFPLPDIGVGNCPAWGDYVLENVVKCCGRKPDVFISGEEDRRISWFGDDTAEIFIPKTISISATKMKEFIIRDDKAQWDEYIEPAIADRYEYMKKIIIDSMNTPETKSI